MPLLAVAAGSATRHGLARVVPPQRDHERRTSTRPASSSIGDDHVAVGQAGAAAGLSVDDRADHGAASDTERRGPLGVEVAALDAEPDVVRPAGGDDVVGHAHGDVDRRGEPEPSAAVGVAIGR